MKSDFYFTIGTTRAAKKTPSFVLLSSDDLATKRKKPPLSFDDYVKATLDTLDEAIELASHGKTVVVDSWITKKVLDLRSSRLFETKIFGLWCNLSCLKDRYNRREGVRDAWKNSALESDYKERYGDKCDEEIIENKGSWKEETVLVRYELFFNTEESSTEVIAKMIQESGRIPAPH